MSDDVSWPQHELGKKLSNWGRWGADDQIGTLNFVTAEKRIAAAQLVRTGKIFDLSLPFDKNGPWLPDGWRFNPIHKMTLVPGDSAGAPDGCISADDMIIMGLQAGTQWDGLGHVGYGDRFYNDVPARAVNNFTGAAKNGYENVVKNLTTRGVLLDIARAKGVDRLEESYEITEADLLAAEERQGVRVGSGDVVLLRTGWMQWFHEGNKEQFNTKTPGPFLDTCRWIHDREIAALAMDQGNGEVWPCPIENSIIPFHQVVIRDIGLTLGEMFDLEELSADCEDDGVWEFLFTGPGLKVTGAVGSPVTPIAIK
ncbi:MAG: cyclase family protein [Pseudonocardia sp.]|nr:cyclase family protein [Pseudonocardia sp.]